MRKVTFFGTLTIYNSLYILVIGILIYVFGIKLSYQGQACNIASSDKNVLKDNNN
ncbi:hypothetical protein [Clostridium sp. JS66]|uniref:hypothetical protein n=1 Tax=Clostridium sp. JS66 TaxID=3064705 RepID=UPI00298DE06F|nr:hypothetical protein [Clostridium sp. JS66]WPC39866.1 hypothetical protein Q6H37_18345 [Clostridium sp. JS66]